MAKYEVTRSCGHTETIALFGKHKDREWRLGVEAEKLCYNCWKAEVERKRAEENQRAAEEAKESGLPELTGSEKQIVWAETLRIQMLSKIEDFSVSISKASEERRKALNISLDDLSAVTQQAQTRTASSWWIDHRGLSPQSLVELLLREIHVNKTGPPESVISKAETEATVRPENPKTETVAEIQSFENAIRIIFPEKREDFRELVKSKLKMRWNGYCWNRGITIKNGPYSDRAAEAGNVLLAAGFPIRIYDEQIRQKAISGEYGLEITRWIMAKVKGDYTGWFTVSWSREEDYYDAARKITGSKYSRPDVVVPPEQFEQVLDFARMYWFELSPGAIDLVDKAKKAKEDTLIVKVEEPERKERLRKPGDKPPVLETPEEVVVDETLRD